MAKRRNYNSFSNEWVYNLPEEIFQCHGNRAVQTSPDNSILFVDKRFLVRSHLCLGVPWNGSNLLVSSPLLFRTSFRTVGAVSTYLTSRLVGQFRFFFEYFSSGNTAQFSVRTWRLSLSAFATSSSAWRMLGFSIKASFQFTPHGSHALPTGSVLWCHLGYGKGCAVHRWHLPNAPRERFPPHQHRKPLQTTSERGHERQSKWRMVTDYLRGELYQS